MSRHFDRKASLCILASLLLTSLLCIWLYTCNNKYTHAAAQPVNGELALSAEDIRQHPLRFLTEEWTFYPDVMLSPEQFDQGQPDAPFVYMDIGASTRFDGLGTRNTPFGCGTYVLDLSLPAGQTYALELPEIFSAFRLYAGDQLLAETGNPDAEFYVPRTQIQTAAFESSGQVRLILAVRNASHIYSGLIYPPAFGTPQAVNLYHYLRFGICIMGCTAVFLFVCLSFFLAFRMRSGNALLSAWICLALIGFTSYPLVHTLLRLPVFPWYPLEIFCGYAVTLLVILLHNRLCCPGRTVRLISQGAAALVCLLALLYSSLAPWLTTPVMRAFSTFITLYKTAAAAYLLITALWCARQKKPEAYPLLCGTVCYSAFLLWDRLLPAYEPVYGGWFSELGSFVLILALFWTVWKDILHAYTFHTSFVDDYRQLSRQAAIQQAHYQELTDKLEETARHRHDERHHLILMSTFLEQGRLEELKDYLARYQQSIEPVEHITLCRCLCADAVLQYYRNLCRKEDILFTVSAQLPAHIHVSDTDVAILFGNLLENALDACRAQQESERHISVKTSYQEDRLLLRVENSYETPVRMNRGRYLSGKHGGYGIGTETVNAVVDRYQGQIKYDVEDTLFRVSLIL
ncbi:MAG: GHKL domain-containing protein [Clostridiales bacterium]|nr:GHKL domain-containing protein [Clostridiales bacterium]